MNTNQEMYAKLRALNCKFTEIEKPEGTHLYYAYDDDKHREEIGVILDSYHPNSVQIFCDPEEKRIGISLTARF